MKSFITAAVTSCLAAQALAGAVAWSDNSPRAVQKQELTKRVTVNTLPLVNPLCHGYSVNVADISSAVNQGGNMMANNVQRGKNDYPHEFKNLGSGTSNLFTWANCPAGAGTWYEYPVLRNAANPWLAAKGTKLGPTEPDRAIFQVNGVSTVTYCGMITHDGAAANGQFIQCT